MQPGNIDKEGKSESPDQAKTNLSPQERLMAAGKTLFAQNGFESTSTSSIASRARTSESQLVRHFGGKAGLLEEIFNAGWTQLNDRIGSKVIAAPTGREGLLIILKTLTTAFQRDEELARIYLFEGRRIRGNEHEVFLSEGFVSFRQLIISLVHRAQADGSFVKSLPEEALVSALIGCAEGMVRDRLIARRLDKPEQYSPGDMHKVVDAVLSAF